MTTATVPLSPRRTRMLGHLAEHPRTTAYELGKALGLPGRLGKELEDMQSRGLVVSDTEWRSSMGRNVRVWSEAPAGTPVPSRPRLSQAELRRRRERDTRTNRARRARMRAEAAGPADCPATAPGHPALYRQSRPVLPRHRSRGGAGHRYLPGLPAPAAVPRPRPGKRRGLGHLGRPQLRASQPQ